MTPTTELSKGWSDKDTFNFWVPIQAVNVVEKSSTNAKGVKSTKRWVQGIASTEDRDLQGEIVSQNGIDFSYFLKHGFFNNDHKPGFENKVGQPTECRVTKNGLWVKGFLFDKNKVADEIWDMIQSLDASGANRRVGFSVQGKVKRRDGSTIKECWIQDIAITPSPVNPATWAEIAKSLTAMDSNMDLKKDKTEDKDEDAEKAMTAAASPVVPESLDGSVKTSVSKSLSMAEAVEFIKSETGMTHDGAEATARVIFSMMQE